MKVNKITIVCCIIVSFLSAIFLIFFGLFVEETRANQVIENIATGIFTSSIVSCVISVVSYFNEHNIIIGKIDNNFKSLYVNMSVLSKMIGIILPQIRNADLFSNLMFGNVYGLSGFNVDFLNNMNLGLYNPFYKRGKMYNVCMLLTEFQQTAYNIKNISADLQIKTLEYDNQLLRFKNNSVNGIQSSPMDIYNNNELKNLINIRTAKLHEYTEGKILELEKIAKIFYNKSNSKQPWEDIKKNLLQQVEDILKR